MSKNIENLNKFLKNQHTLLINTIDDRSNAFYLYLISSYAKELKFKIDLKDGSNIATLQEKDLFSLPLITIYQKIPSKKIDTLLKLKDKKILFLDYKSFKSLSSKYLSINTYDIKNDINFYIKNDLKISNLELQNFILNSPEYTYSEISKVQINSKNYLKLYSESSDDKIANIRKEIFTTKGAAHLDLKLLLSLLKKEVGLKKFNFLVS